MDRKKTDQIALRMRSTRPGRSLHGRKQAKTDHRHESDTGGKGRCIVAIPDEAAFACLSRKRHVYQHGVRPASWDAVVCTFQQRKRPCGKLQCLYPTTMLSLLDPCSRSRQWLHGASFPTQHTYMVAKVRLNHQSTGYTHSATLGAKRGANRRKEESRAPETLMKMPKLTD